MTLTLMVGWLALSVLLAALWSRMIGNAQGMEPVHDEVLPSSKEGNVLLLVPPPRRTQEGMAEFTG